MTNEELADALEQAGEPPTSVYLEAAARIRQMGSDLVDLQIWAKRYADGRSTYAPGMVNEVTRRMIRWGLTPTPGGEGTVWAKDGDGFGDPDLDHFTPGTDTARGLVLGLPAGHRVAPELLRELGLEPGAGVESVLTEVRKLKRCG